MTTARATSDNFVTRFFQLEAAGGLLLMIAAALAVLVANTPLVKFYDLLLDTPVAVRIAGFSIDKPLLLWINDGLMAVFFFLIGLELKRELLEGELADRGNIILPALGAIGGMAVPALIYIFFNRGDQTALAGWAIPAATDIAFALGILSLVGSKVPRSVKIFLTSLAIFDDIGAILVIALFYTAKISVAALWVVAGCIVVLAVLSRLKVSALSLYIVVGLVMWAAVLKSGVHATLAGVVLAMFIPLRSASDPAHSPLKSLEHDLHAVVAFLILPVFAFANAGIRVAGVTLDQAFHGVPVGVAVGLFVGKQLGVFTLCWLGIRLGLTKLPAGMGWSALYGTAALTGIGFTMSLFVGSLAFEQTGVDLLFDERMGIIVGSLASGGLGYAVLRSIYRPLGS
jgi:NhaA family Na+:H+ antiporter